jgi:predicted PurR-regulated permease PerM
MALQTSFPTFSPRSDNRAALLQGLLIGTIIIAALYAGREVLLPLTLAVLLSFVLTPPLRLLRRLKVPRGLSVALVVTFAFLIILAVGWVISLQITQLAADLPKYQTTFSEKIDRFQKSVSNAPFIREITNTFTRVEQELASPKPDTSVGAVPPPPEQTGDQKPVPVEIHSSPKPLELFQQLAGTVLPPLVTGGIVLLFVIFILLQREDLRDRLIRLLGASDIQRATAAVTDAASRLSKYFLRQVLINSAFGLFITFGLWLIGIPTPVVWGILATLMRFVPYIGSYIAAAFPLLLAIVVDPGWGSFLLTGTLYLVSELTMGQVVEPLVYAQGTGLSPVAVVLSTVFWAWLWGPIGLVLATPLTVVFVVLGRHLEGLKFLEIMLSDEPALSAEERFYQRLLTGDPAEATYEIELCLKEGRRLITCLDDFALKALHLAQSDSERGILDEEHRQRIAWTMSEVADNLASLDERRSSEKEENRKSEEINGLASLAVQEKQDESVLPILKPSEVKPGWNEDSSIICIGARTYLDNAAADMLASLIRKSGLQAREMDSDAISPAHIVSFDAIKAKLVSLTYLGMAGRPAHIRYLIQRLRRILPRDCMILLSYLGEDANAAMKALKATAEADAYASSLGETVETIVNLARSVGTVIPLRAEKTTASEFPPEKGAAIIPKSD